MVVSSVDTIVEVTCDDIIDLETVVKLSVDTANVAASVNGTALDVVFNKLSVETIVSSDSEEFAASTVVLLQVNVEVACCSTVVVALVVAEEQLKEIATD